MAAITPMCCPGATTCTRSVGAGVAVGDGVEVTVGVCVARLLGVDLSTPVGFGREAVGEGFGLLAAVPDIVGPLVGDAVALGEGVSVGVA